MPAVPARPVIRRDDRLGNWMVETPGLTLTWQRAESGEVTLTSLLAGGREWIATPVSAFTLGSDPSSSIALTDVDMLIEDDGRVLRFDGRLDALGLNASLRCVTYDDGPVVMIAVSLSNRTDHAVEVGELSSFRFQTPTSNDARLGVLAGGRWDSMLPPRGYRLETADLRELRGSFGVGTAADGRSSGEHVPWFSLMAPGGGVLAALVWSGRWRLEAQRAESDVLLGLGLAEFRHILAPGERLELPMVALFGYAGDLDDGANAWREWITQHWMPPVPDDWPWVQYNHWYAYHGDIDEARLLNEAHYAAGVGCDVFVIDDGWFRGRRPDSYYAGWGDWREEPSKFPGGLRVFGNRIRELGMRFGIWVEPERADPDGKLIQEHHDWVATRDGRPIARLPDGTGGVHLCLGNLDVQEWMASDLIHVVQDYGVDWLKWDYNIGYGLGCDRGDHGHQTGDGHYAHTLGLYRVLEELRTACPDLVIENCASGGHRVDLGILRHSHTSWLSDYSHRASSCRQHAQGAGLVLPIEHLNTWVLEKRDATEFRSRMGGAFGVSSRLGDWSDVERQALANAITEYRRLRSLLKGRRHLLSGPLHQDWDIWQFVERSGNAFAILAFHESSQINAVRVRPREINSERTYRVERTGCEHPLEVEGSILVSDGLTFELTPHGSEIVWCIAKPG